LTALRVICAAWGQRQQRTCQSHVVFWTSASHESLQ